MSIYREDLEGLEREIFIESFECDNELLKCMALYEMSKIKYEQMCNDAELKVLTESGTYDDLAFLYQEANQVAEQEQGNIFQRMWAALCNFFRGIKNFFTGHKDIPDDMAVSVPANTREVVGNIKAAFTNPVQFLAKVASSPAAKATGGFMAALGGMFALNSAYKKVTKSEAETWVDELNAFAKQKISAIQGLLSQGLSSLGNTVKGIPVVGDLFSWLVDKAKEIGNLIKNCFGKAVDAVKNRFGGKAKKMGKEADKALVDAQKQQRNAKTPQERAAADAAVQKAGNLQTNARNQRIHEDRLNNNRDRALNRQNSDGSTGSSYTLGNSEYRLDGNGKTLMTRVNKAGVGPTEFRPMSDREVQLVPKDVRRHFGFESADDEVIDASEIRDFLGDDYEVSVAESGDALDIVFVGENAEDDIVGSWFVDDAISIQKSIFGSDPDEEGFTESYEDDIDDELASLLD
ncbi:MAG: hypothetical protein SOZ83_06035 [Sphaerochaetaceae bacterium]|nr:hypothetical protein [Sphaerochaetaceae bacterium]